jgi:hypothetical protein
MRTPRCAAERRPMPSKSRRAISRTSSRERGHAAGPKACARSRPRLCSRKFPYVNKYLGAFVRSGTAHAWRERSTSGARLAAWLRGGLWLSCPQTESLAARPRGSTACPRPTRGSPDGASRDPSQ